MKTSVNFSSALIFFMLLILLFTGCARSEDVGACLSGHTYGFFGGLWHGFIAPFDFIGMLFNDNITMYAQNNNGALYALGFLLGSGGWGFFGSRGARKIRYTRVRTKNDMFDDAEIVK
ncbi:MAG TPA: hypothetical protein P5320_10870 [Bacteroidales bacterium]|nr:hypothetical protein [Bacteroidales bacterium]HOK73634.1 hypothetical protein [Bacteroidales bacterium]HOM39370.1 hypothetical protein [Bacteroidales bacterium]HOU31283.1 hypothetical protein [Bacteroidales bacterium]HPP91479.1 hypothetical protein [Bacteroidales bacterium]